VARRTHFSAEWRCGWAGRGKAISSENFVISVPFVVKKEHHHPNTFCHTYAICGSKQSNQPQKARKPKNEEIRKFCDFCAFCG
jgi:hypothetical protein